MFSVKTNTFSHIKSKLVDKVKRCKGRNQTREPVVIKTMILIIRRDEIFWDKNKTAGPKVIGNYPSNLAQNGSVVEENGYTHKRREGHEGPIMSL